MRLVVVENGVRDIDRHVLPDDCDETVVIRQFDGELPVDLVRRSIRRIAAIEQSRRRITRAVVLVAPNADKQSMAARSLLARAILTHAHPSFAGATEFTFFVDADVEPDLRHELLGLVEAIIGLQASRAAPIRLRFGEPSEDSTLTVRKSGFWPRSSAGGRGDASPFLDSEESLPAIRRRTGTDL
jgi:hypothetical protein